MGKPLFILAFLLWMLSSVNCYAQTAASGSLKDLHSKLLNSGSDEERVCMLASIGMRHVFESENKTNTKSIDSAAYYLKKAQTLNEKLDYENGLGRCYNLSANLYRAKGQFERSRADSQKAIDIFTKLNDKHNTAAALQILGGTIVAEGKTFDAIEAFEKANVLYQEMGAKSDEAVTLLKIAYIRGSSGKTEKAIAELEKALVLFDETGNNQVQRIYSLLAVNYYKLGKNDKAIENGLKGIRIVEDLSDNGPVAAELYFHMGLIHSGMNEQEKAYAYFFKALTTIKKFTYPEMEARFKGYVANTLTKLDRKDEALAYMDELQKEFKNPKPGVRMAVALNCLDAYVRLKDYKNAEKFVDAVNEGIAKMDAEDVRRSVAYSALADYYFATGSYKLARKTAEKNMQMNEKLKSPKVLEHMHRIFFRLDSIDSNYKSSLEHLKKAQAYSDSIYSRATAEKYTELQIKYEVEKKNKNLQLQDKNNRLLKQRAQLQESRLSQSNLVRNVSLAGILVLMVIIALIYRRYLVNKRIRAEIGLKNSALQSLLNEKEWLLKEIHHRVKNNLQVVMSLLNTQSYFLDDEKAKAAIRNSQHRIHSMSLIHKKLYQSDNTASINMQLYINELVEYFRTSFDIGQRIRFETTIEPIELKTEQAVPLGLILNEAITNAIKHAFPDNREGVLSIELQCKNNVIAVAIQDNGVGITNTTDNNSSLGMRLIKGFSGELNASLEIINGNGLTIRLEFEHPRKIEKVSA